MLHMSAYLVFESCTFAILSMARPFLIRQIIFGLRIGIVRVLVARHQIEFFPPLANQIDYLLIPTEFGHVFLLTHARTKRSQCEATSWLFEGIGRPASLNGLEKTRIHLVCFRRAMPLHDLVKILKKCRVEQIAVGAQRRDRRVAGVEVTPRRARPS